MIKLGFMSFAHMHAFSYAKAAQVMDNVELVSVYDTDAARGQAAADQFEMNFYSDLTAFFNSGIDAVIICSENSLHKEMVIAAAQSGKDILCEKPIATNVADAEEMIAVCDENEVILQIAFPVRFMDAMQALKETIDSGSIGEIVAIRSTNRGQNPGGWFIDQDLAGGGAVLDHTVHLVDIMRWIMDSEVTSIYSSVDSFYHGIDVDDAGIMTLEFENGVIASHDASWSRFEAYPTWGDVRIEVIGTKDTVNVNLTSSNLIQIAAIDEKNFRTLRYLGFGNNTDSDLVADFIDCVQNKRTPFITGKDGLKAMEVGLAAYESSEKQARVYL